MKKRDRLAKKQFKRQIRLDRRSALRLAMKRPGWSVKRAKREADKTSWEDVARRLRWGLVAEAANRYLDRIFNVDYKSLFPSVVEPVFPVDETTKLKMTGTLKPIDEEAA